MNKFIKFNVVSYQPAQNGRGERVDRFEMNVRAKAVFGANTLAEGPTPEAITIVYFDPNTGMRPMLSSDPVEEILAKVVKADA